MQDNTLTLAVDHDHDATTTNEAFVKIETYLDRSVYKGPDHSLTSRNLLAITRNTPTVSGNFRGVLKTSLKFTTDIEVEGVDTSTTNVAPALGVVNFSLPVGFTPAEAMHLRERIIAGLNHQDFIVRLTEEREI